MIHVENLTKYYNHFCAVDQINLDIHRGEILGLLGPNGAGKTTTLRMLTGYFPPSSGTIRINAYAIDEKPLEIKKMMGYLPESAPIYHSMLVYDYLVYVADIRGIQKELRLPRIKKLVDLCGLANIMHKTIDELSKGLKQRVGLAHAMMADPEILILDEPTSGLDPNQIVEIREIIRQIGKEKTVILSTHILSEAEATCNRIVIINQGKIVADGSTSSLKNDSATDVLIHLELKNADPQAAKSAFEGIDGIHSTKITPLPNSDSTELVLTCKSTPVLRENIYHFIKQTDWILLDFHQETKTLENIFRELTQEN